MINKEFEIRIWGLLKGIRKAGFRYGYIGTNVGLLFGKNKLYYSCHQALHMELLNDPFNPSRIQHNNFEFSLCGVGRPGFRLGQA